MNLLIKIKHKTNLYKQYKYIRSFLAILCSFQRYKSTLTFYIFSLRLFKMLS